LKEKYWNIKIKCSKAFLHDDMTVISEVVNKLKEVQKTEEDKKKVVFRFDAGLRLSQ